MEEVILEGRFLHNRYHNETNGYTVALIRPNDHPTKIVTVTGYFPPLIHDQNYRFFGSYEEHPRYGLQFVAEHYESINPQEESGIIDYLCSPKFPGIGEKTAARLVKDFGDHFIDLLIKNPEILDQVSYLNEKKKEVLRNNCLNSNDENEKVYQFFSQHYLTMKQILIIQNVYKEEMMEKILEDPYRIVNEVKGFMFKTVDRLGRSLDIPEDDLRRLKAIAYLTLNQATMSKGDSYLQLDEYLELLARNLNGILYDEDNLLNLLVRQRMAVIDSDKIYPYAQYDAEETIAAYFARFPEYSFAQIEKKKLSKMIKEVENSFAIEYDDTQREAIETFFEKDAMILTGGPGTGKTTIVRAIIALIRRLYPTSSIVLAAPTGRASKRLKELTGYEAKTIHSVLRFDLETGTFAVNQDNPLLDSILIVDEFSMVDQYLLASLLKASLNIRKILFIGDEDQLPSVAPGQVLKDLIDSNIFPCVRLKHIFRQKEGSEIIELAHEISDGTECHFTGEVTFKEADLYEVEPLVLQEYQKALELGYSPNDVQVLAPIYNGIAGIDALNRNLQKACNPADRLKREIKLGVRTLRVGDKILQLKNQPDDEVFNGDIGILTEISYPGENQTKQTYLTVDYDGIKVDYSTDELDKITHAFCVSVHKSQGSEYPVVIMPVLKEYGIMLQKRLLYTGITRATKTLILIGSKPAFQQGLNSHRFEQRNTTLQEKVAKEYQLNHDQLNSPENYPEE